VVAEQNRHDSKARELIQSIGVEHLLQSAGFACIGSSQRATIVEFSKKHFPVEKADETSDRLRREADRVANLAGLKTALTRAEHKLEQLKSDLSGLQTQREAKRAEWIVQWEPAGIKEPLTPAEMQEWLQRHRTLAQLCVSFREEEAELSRMEQVVGSHRKQLLDELASLGLTGVSEEATLQDIIGRGRGIVETVAALKELVVEIEQGDDCRSRVQQMETSISEFRSDVAQLIAGTQMTELDARRDELSNERGEKRTALGNLDRSDDLAAEVQNSQSAIAEAKSAVERYVSLHLAAEILSLEIERYQKENQDPVLARASEIFPALTLNSFGSVATQHTTKGSRQSTRRYCSKDSA
jgi:uncharacterized protein YhaN